MIQEEQLTPYTTSDIPSDNNILVLAPHPDDEIFGCGGALALHVENKCFIHVILVTSGDVAGDTLVRLNESKAASKVLGPYTIETWNYPDRKVHFTKELIERIVHIILKNEISLVYAPSLWENHPDHRAVALSAIDALRQVKNCSLMQYEVGAPLRPNMLVDITSVLDTKTRAMECFSSQLENQEYNQHILGLNKYRSYTLEKEVRSAEAYEYYSAKDLRLGEISFFQSQHQRHQKLNTIDVLENFPLVSILIRSMNKQTLEKALMSAAMQTYLNIEIIIVNASGKKHQNLEKEINKSTIHFIDSQEQLSRPQAANIALKHSNGKYALFLDDDDWIDALHVEKLVYTLEKNNLAILAYTGTSLVNELGDEISLFNTQYSKEQIYIANFMPIHSVLFRKEVYEEFNCQFDEELDLYEDWDFWIQLCEYGDFAYITGVSAYYLIANGGSSAVHNQEIRNIKKNEIFNKWKGIWKPEIITFLADEIIKKNNEIVQYKYVEEENDKMKMLLEEENDKMKIFINSRAWRLIQKYRHYKDILFQFQSPYDLYVNIKRGLEKGKDYNGKILYQNKFISKSKKKLLLFSHYDKDNIVDDYVIYYLQALLDLGCDIVFISTAKLLQNEIEKVQTICSHVIVKENIGYDFGAWKTALEHSSFIIENYDELILCNDSVYAPLYDIKEMFFSMKQKNLDIWGITESYDISEHIQSYFLVFSNKVIQEDKLFDFFRHYKVYKNKRNIIVKYEIGLSELAKKYNYTRGVYCPILAKMDKKTNVSHQLWDTLVVDKRCPTLKVELLRKNPLNLDLSNLDNVIENTNYPLEIIKKHLKRVL